MSLPDNNEILFLFSNKYMISKYKLIVSVALLLFVRFNTIDCDLFEEYFISSVEIKSSYKNPINPLNGFPCAVFKVYMYKFSRETLSRHHRSRGSAKYR